jgi:carboxyl-terminal processing protease
MAEGSLKAPMTSRTRFIVLVVTAPVIAFAIIGGLVGKTWAREETYQHLRVFEDVVSLISTSYVEPANMTRVMRGALRGLAEGLDADSAYLAPDEARIYQSGQKPASGETGIELTRMYYLRVIAARDGSPAAKAGLEAGDFLRAIDGTPTRDMSVYEGRRLLRGAPGTVVKLLVIRGNVVDPHEVTLTREVLEGPDVAGRMQDAKTGYVRIAAFGPECARSVAAQAGALKKDGATSLLVDVRDTATGGYDSGIAVARLFVAHGTLGFREMHGSARKAVEAASGDGAITLPTVLLVDAGTSGAAEVFAAALAGNQRATLVGEHTQGRAAFQQLIPLPDDAAMIVSNGWLLTPSGEPIHEKGLTPGVAVEVPDVEFGAPLASVDLILQKGIATLKNKIG